MHAYLVHRISGPKCEFLKCRTQLSNPTFVMFTSMKYTSTSTRTEFYFIIKYGVANRWKKSNRYAMFTIIFKNAFRLGIPSTFLLLFPLKKIAWKIATFLCFPSKKKVPNTLTFSTLHFFKQCFVQQHGNTKVMIFSHQKKFQDAKKHAYICCL